jgi:hypothetical protein
MPIKYTEESHIFLAVKAELRNVGILLKAA